MPFNSDSAKSVPMMFRAQVEGRCQLQRIDPARQATRERPRQKQDAEIWAEELTRQVHP